MSAAPRRIERADAPAEDRARPSVAPVETPKESAAPASEAPRRPKRKRRRLLMIALPLLLLIGGGVYWLMTGRYVGTNNAYVNQAIVSVSPDVAGRIVAVEAAQNQKVENGATLFKLDPKPFQIALDQADAALASARLQVGQLKAAYSTAEAKLKAAQAIFDVNNREYERQKKLVASGVSTSSALDAATMTLRSSQNDVALAQEGVTAAAAALGGNPKIATDDFPAVKVALAQRELAQRNLNQATVVAPVAGVVSQIGNLNVGQYVTPGSPVMSLVQTGQTWVEANFKETEIETIKVGQPVTVTVDSYPGLTLHGTVQSFSSATGSEFSLIPAQNATGNWVKVVQRLAVRIAITPEAQYPLRDGMSAEVSVDTGKTNLDRLR